MDFPNLNVWVQIGKCFDYVPQFFQITCELHGSPLTITLQPIMTARNRRTFDFGSQSDDSQSYGYGGGGGACPQSNVALHRDRWMGAAEHEDEETCAPFPNITALVQQHRDTQGGPVTSTPAREGRSPTSPGSPVLGYGLGVRTSSLFSMSATPTSAAAYSSADSTLAVPSAATTNVSRTVAAPAPGHVIAAAQQSRGKGGPGRVAGVDKEGSDAINVIVLQAILAENRMVCAFLGHKGGSKMTKKDTMTSLIHGLGKHSNPFVRKLSTSALNKRILQAVDTAKVLALSSDREKLAKLKDNDNEKNADAGDNLDAYDKCILELAIQEEKLTRAKKEEEERKQANQQDQSVRLQAVSKVTSRVDAAEQNTRKRKLSARDKTLDKQLQEEENEVELVEEELRDPDQMNVDEHGEDLVQEVRDRATAARVEVARLLQQEELELINALTPKSKNKALLDRLNRNKA